MKTVAPGANDVRHRDARFLRVERPASWWDCAGLHLPIVMLAGVAGLIIAFVPLRRIPFPDCAFLVYSGYPCPFCGFTRSFQLLLHGQARAAWENCPLAVPLFALLLVLFLVNACALIRGVRITRGAWLRPPPGCVKYITILLLLLLAANWLYRLAAGLR
ncbi:MAG: DUF2752 domain-containing protein [Spartobacteria bacterium]|nr:DUF2752 domain-containing protein [Spartobacteria bacterium]